MVAAQTDAYNQVHYSNYSYPQTHVDRLASIATLFGMKPAPVENCRVLELACGDGSNLLPMAYDLSESRFLGIDRAARPIERGRGMIEALQLRNLELRQLDLIDTPSTLGEFDYIIAHGLYSWVSSDVRDRIMEIIHFSLAPQGVAYISYNVYPGCRLREIAREMMLFHTRDVSDPKERVAQGRALLKWLADAQTQSTAYSLFLHETRDSLFKANDGAVYHDALAEFNEPVYFHQFLNHAVRFDLKFLSEAEHFNVREHEFPVEVAQQLRTLADQDVAAREQYLDFLEGRTFRQTLLCHQDVEINREFAMGKIKKFYLSSAARPVSGELDLRSTKVERFKAPKDADMTTNFPLAKAAMFHLGQIYPRALRFDDLVTEGFRLIGGSSAISEQEMIKDSQTLAELMLKTYGAGVLEFHLHRPRLTIHPGERPLASPLARLQARSGAMTTSLLGNNVRIDDFVGLQLLLLLDGTRDRVALIQDLLTIIELDSKSSSPALKITTDDRRTLIQELPQQLDVKIAELARLGFLLA
ncbi:MAG TPA: class I SAM-dependent methyltransferase [Pyrinomonadaceae bacterium]